MYKQSLHTLSTAALLSFGLIASLPAAAKCGCPDDGHGAPKPKFTATPTATTMTTTTIATPAAAAPMTGLGESFPRAPDLVADPAWQVYEFERDGIRYVQINDAIGKVRAAVGRIDDTFWVMPIGSDADRVSIPGGQGRPTGQRGTVLLRRDDLEVGLKVQGGKAYWRIGTPAVAAEPTR